MTCAMRLLPGLYSPAVLVNAFVQEVGAALSTVKEIEMSYTNTSGSAFTTAVLDQSVAMLVQACPSLVTLHSNEHLSLQLVRLLGEACPTLHELRMGDFGLHPFISTVQSVLPELHVAFPQLRELDLPTLKDQMLDMSHLRSVRSLRIHSLTFLTEAQWHMLPPRLQTLYIDQLEVGPPTTKDGATGRSLLPYLLYFNANTTMPLHAVAQLLRAAPALRDLGAGFEEDCDNDEETHPFVQVKESLTASADLLVLRDRSSLPSIKNIVYCFNGHEYQTVGVLQPILATLPRMTGSTSCMFVNCNPSLLTQLLEMFPDVCDLALGGNMNNLQLQSLVVCAQLKRLKLHQCNLLGPVALALVCERLPGLCHVRCEGCARLQVPDLEECKQSLMRDILLIERDASKGILCGDWS